MKIVEIQAIRANRFCHAKMMTDEDIYGIDEDSAFGIIDMVTVWIRSFNLYLVGKNPLNIGHHWQIMFHGMFFRGTTVMGVLSAIDVVLWNIADKYYNAPVYQLMGGKCRNRMLIYGHVIALGDEGLVESCKKRREQGFKALRHLSPFLNEGEDTPYNRAYTKNMEDVIRYIHLMRETMGDDVDLCTGLRRHSPPAEAVVSIREIADVHPLFVEDPIPPGGGEATTYVVQHNRVPIATRERPHMIYEFQDLLNRQAANYIRMSLTTVGGLAGARKIVALAENEICLIVPHNPLSPVCIAAGMQLCTCIDNLLVCEYPSRSGRLSRDSTSTDRKCDMVTGQDKPVDGYIIPSSVPGVGTNLILDIEKHFPPITYVPGGRLNIDDSAHGQ